MVRVSFLVVSRLVGEWNWVGEILRLISGVVTLRVLHVVAELLPGRVLKLAWSVKRGWVLAHRYDAQSMLMWVVDLKFGSLVCTTVLQRSSTSYAGAHQPL
jgi:hypothetical protein